MANLAAHRKANATWLLAAGCWLAKEMAGPCGLDW